MTHGSAKLRRRGQPLLALAVLLLTWAGARAMLWESPFADVPILSQVGPVVAPAASPAAASPPPVRSSGIVTVMPGDEAPVAGGVRSALSASLQGPAAYRIAEAIQRTEAVAPADAPSVFTLSGQNGPISSRPVPAVVAAITGQRAWRVDGWMAWRSGSGLTQAATGARPASYGGTQAGLAMRYDLALGDRRPALHLRATHAPDRPRQSELALGLGLRPLAHIPLRVQAEARSTHSAGRTEVRPALLAHTELSSLDLPLGLVGEGYAQGGWVGGRDHTPFADGQARITASLAQAGPLRLRAGAGVWGGAQKFAERLDVGPTLGVELTAGPAPLRLSVDYRRRVAGAASPGNGLAVTLSTGF